MTVRKEDLLDCQQGRLDCDSNVDITMLPDCSKIMRFSDGLRKLVQPDGVVIIQYQCGDRFVQKPDGTRIIAQSDGEIFVLCSDGMMQRVKAGDEDFINAPWLNYLTVSF